MFKFKWGDEAQKAWVNLNRFMAHVSHQQRLTPVKPLQVWPEEFGTWTIADGLENPDLEASKYYVAAAAEWLLVAGSDIHGDEMWGQRGLHPLRGKLWEKGRRAADRTHEKRWGFWRERLLEIAGDGGFDEGTREAAKQVEEAMSKI